MGGRKDKMTGHKITLKIREHPYKTSALFCDFLMTSTPRIRTAGKFIKQIFSFGPFWAVRVVEGIFFNFAKVQLF